MSKKDKTKVLMIGTSRSTRGGITTVVNDYLNSCLPEVFNIRYLATHCDGSKLAKLGVAVHSYARFMLLMLFFRPTIVHIHASSRASFFRKTPFVLLSSVLNKFIIYHQHGSEFMTFFLEESSPIQQQFIRWVLNRTTVILALSRQWEQNLKSIDPALPVKVLPNAVFIPDLSARPATASTEKKILFMGRIGRRKGVHDLLDAVKKLSKKNSQFCLIAAGDGDITTWKKKCRQLGISSCVEFPGWTSDAEKRALFEQADIYVLPSYNEGLPMSVLEAMAYGLPIVSTPVGGIPEAVINNHNGFLVPPGGVEELAHMLNRLIENDPLRLEMGRASRKLAEKKFDLTVIIKTLVKLYNSAVSTKT